MGRGEAGGRRAVAGRGGCSLCSACRSGCGFLGAPARATQQPGSLRKAWLSAVGAGGAAGRAWSTGSSCWAHAVIGAGDRSGDRAALGGGGGHATQTALARAMRERLGSGCASGKPQGICRLLYNMLAIKSTSHGHAAAAAACLSARHRNRQPTGGSGASHRPQVAALLLLAPGTWCPDRSPGLQQLAQ